MNILATLLALSLTVTPANDSRITYVARTQANPDNSVSFDWTASQVRIAFSGDYLAVKAGDSRKDYFNVWIDKDPCAEPDKQICISSQDTLIVLADGLSKKADHRVTLQKRTEGSQGRCTIKEIHTHGPLLQAEKLKERKIEFVGDSYTCGYGAENSVASDGFTPETETASKSYAAICARYFGADYLSISHSGMGIARNYGEMRRSDHMPERYLQTFDEDRERAAWDASSYDFHPALTVIYLGTNDFSVNLQPMYRPFTANYIRLINEIKANYGEDHPILCVASKVDPQLFRYIEEMINNARLKNVWYASFFNGVHFDDDRNLGADWHPNYAAHQKLAYALIPYISTLTGWPLNDNPVK